MTAIVAATIATGIVVRGPNDSTTILLENKNNHNNGTCETTRTTTTTTTKRQQQHDDDDDDDDDWFGGEPHMYDVTVEEQGIDDILNNLTESERHQVEMDDKTMPIRFFRAEKGDVLTATQRLRNTLKWRKEVGIDNLIQCMHPKPGEILSPQLLMLREKFTRHISSGYFCVRGYDKIGRAVVCIQTKATIADDLDMHFMHVLYTVERAIACTKRKSTELSSSNNRKNKNNNSSSALQKIIFVGDVCGPRNINNKTPISFFKNIVGIFGEHYPERIQCFYLVNPASLVKWIYNIVYPFLDPVTKKKVMICSKDDDLEDFRRNLANINKMERCYTHINNNNKISQQSTINKDDDVYVRSFDPEVYINLPFDVAFDE